MRRKRTWLAVLLAAAMLLSGSVTAHADEEALPEETQAETSEEAPEETVSTEEAEEEFFSTAQEVEAVLQSLGETDGYAVYVRPKDYKERITAYTEKQYADETEAADAARELEKHLKFVEAALIDTTTHKLTAELEEIASTKEERIFFSEAGRFLLVLNKDGTAVQRLRYRVSTLDSPYLFLTQDGDTLEYYATDYKSCRAVMQRRAGTEDFASADGLYTAKLSEDGTQVLWCVREAAENDRMKLFYNEDTVQLGLLNKENGYTWWSSPIGANRDTRATATLVSDLESAAVLTYGDSNSRGVSVLRSRSQADIRIREQENGITVTYAFDKAGITIPVSYTLEEDYLAVTLRTADIQETKLDSGISATQLTLMGSFGAASAQEDGYFVIPDGSGALIRFNNGKERAKSYSAKVYGRDLTTVQTTKPPVTEEVCMPVYGIVKEGNALAVIVEEGDGNVTLNASVSGQSLTSFNTCSFSCQLRGSDTFYMAGDYGTITVFEKGPIKAETYRVRYYPLAGEEPDYIDIAKTYRDYLLQEGGVTPKTETPALYVDLYGGCMKSRSVLGIPVTMKTSMTSFEEARKITAALAENGVEDMVVAYHNWTDEGITGKVDNKAKPSGTLGGASDFNKLRDYLEEQGYAFYPAVNNKVFRSGNGCNTLLDTTIRISNAYSRQMDYTLSYGVQDPNQKTHALLSPVKFTDIYGKLAGNYSRKGLNGVSLGELTTALWGDYGKKSMGRDAAIGALQSSYQSLGDAELSLLADGCAAYAFPYADRISHAPLQSSGFDVFDEEIPFYQIVLHGVLPCSGTPVNAGADSDAAFLETIAAGCSPSFDMIYAEASDLKDTAFDKYFYSHYAYWTGTAAAEYKLAKEILSEVSDQYITGYTKDGEVSVTTYADGTAITVDRAAKTITSGTRTWDLEKGA